jgi:hypothetical protein
MSDTTQQTFLDQPSNYLLPKGAKSHLTPHGARRLVRVLQSALLGLAIAGCARDSYEELGLVEVIGRVTLDGQPLPGAKVVFEGDDKRTAIGVTDSGGQYRLMYDSQTPGVVPGPKTVRITLADSDVEGGGASEGAPAKAESIPPRYNRQSELRADVSPSNRTFNFDLKTP